MPLWRRRFLRPFLALAAVNALGLVSYTLPRAAQERSIAARASLLREEVAGKREQVQASRIRAQTIAANEADVRRFYRRLPRKESLPRAQEDIVNAARELGLQIGNRTYANESVPGGPLERFQITMPVAGTYRQVVHFLRRVEALPYFVVVNSVQLRGERAKEEGHIRLDVVLSSYFHARKAAHDAP